MARVEFANKDDLDEFKDEVNDRLDTLGVPQDSSGAITQNEMESAIDDALVAAAADAQSKASGAVNTAASYTDTKSAAAVSTAGTNTTSAISAHNASPTAHGLDIPNVATKAYVDAVAAGFNPDHFKAPVRVVSITNVALSGTQTIDGVTLVAGDPVLLVGQTAAAENGPWIVASGAWSRATDFDSSGEALPGSYFLVLEGTNGAGSSYVLVTSASITLGTTALTFKLYNKPSAYQGSARVQVSGNTISVPDGVIDSNAITSALKDGSAGTATMRSIGSGATQVVAGNDSRLTNARTPIAHAASHAANGSDPIDINALDIPASLVDFTPIPGITATNTQSAVGQVQAGVAALGTATRTSKFHFVSVSSAYAAQRGDFILVDASSADVPITLPAVGNDLAPVVVMKIDSSTHNVNITPPGGAQVQFGSVDTINTQGQSRIYGSNATNWYIAGSFDPLSMFVRTDQANNLNGQQLYNYSTRFDSLGALTSLAVTMANHRGRNIGITTPTSTVATVPIAFPNTVPQGAAGAFTQEGSAPLVFSVAAGGALRHPLNHTRTNGQYSVVSWFCRFNNSGTQADIILTGDTAP